MRNDNLGPAHDVQETAHGQETVSDENHLPRPESEPQRLSTSTTLNDTIDYSEEKIRLDEVCKQILAEKAVLARILKHVIPAYEHIDPDIIAAKYIEGIPEVSSVSVYPAKSKTGPEKTEARISAAGVEDSVPGEGRITFDIRFDAVLPDMKNRKSGKKRRRQNGRRENREPTQIIVNVEAQNNPAPGYPVTKRGIFYGARMISSQYGTVFGKSKYGKLRHVYTIWIFMNPPKSKENTIYQYQIDEHCVFGIKSCMESKYNYDLLTMIMIYLGNGNIERKNALLGMLEVLFSTKIDKDEKKKILSEDYHLQMSETMERRSSEMCNYGDYVEQQAIKRGLKKGMAQGMAQGIARGHSEGALDKLIRIVLKKRALGQPEQQIAEDLLEDPVLVNRIFILAEGKDTPVVDEIVKQMSKEGLKA